jgi:hypothetical protein
LTNISRGLNGEGLALHEESYYKGAREGVICLGFVLGEIALAKTSSEQVSPMSQFYQLSSPVLVAAHSSSEFPFILL